MQNITLAQQMPISKVRDRLATVFNDLKKKKVYYIMRNYKPLGAIIDLSYLKELKRKADLWTMQNSATRLQDEFSEVLRKKGYDPRTVDEKTVNKLLMLDD